MPNKDSAKTSKKPRSINKVSQRKLAEALNISISTVSRCFTNHKGINPQTRACVLRLAEEMGYQYLDNRTRPAAPREQRYNIGVLICARPEEWSSDDYVEPGSLLLSGISEMAQVNSHGIDLRFFDPNLGNEGVNANHAPSLNRWDGVLLIYPFPKHLIDDITLHTPVVSLVEQISKLDLNCVDADHYHGISELIDHLQGLGHEQIAFVCRQWVPQALWTIRRHGALLEKHMVMRKEFDQRNFLKFWITQPDGRKRFLDQVLERIDAGVTAFVCASDHDAFDLIRDLKQRGIRVPRDVSVTGFDGVAGPRDLPKLTTMRIPFWEIGRAAVRRLEKLIERPSEPVAHTYLGCVFEPGETVAPPRKRNVKVGN